MTHPGGPKLVTVDPELRQRVATLIADHGVAEAARRTGLGRLALLGIMGRGSTTAASAALLERGFPSPAMAAARAAGLAGRGRPF